MSLLTLYTLGKQNGKTFNGERACRLFGSIGPDRPAKPVYRPPQTTAACEIRKFGQVSVEDSPEMA